MMTNSMRFRFGLTALVLVAVTAQAERTHAQSLADAARRAQDGQKQTPGRVYTNESLKPGDPPSQPAEPGAAPAAPATEAPAAPKPAASGVVVEEDATGHTNVNAAAPRCILKKEVEIFLAGLMINANDAI